MKKERGKIIGDAVSAVTITVLFVVILLLVVFSAVSYQRSVEFQESSNHTRAVLSYVITAVKSGGASRAELTERGGMQVLVIGDTLSGYEQQIYGTGGSVYESYGKTGSTPNPETALKIGDTEQFAMSWKEDDLLEIRTDEGMSYVHLRGR